jgi:hypothetical protein
MNKFFTWIYDHRATLLSWGATVGTIGGAVAAAKAMSKAHERINQQLLKKMDAAVEEVKSQFSEDEEVASDSRIHLNIQKMDAVNNVIDETDLTIWEKIKAGAPAFILPAIIEVATIGCIHGSNCINQREIRSARDEIQKLTGQIAAGAAAFAAYKDSVGRLTDRTTEYAAEKMAEERAKDEADGKTPWDEVQTFYIEGQPQFFERTMEQVFKAEMELNRIFAIRGDATINEFYKLLGLPETDDGNNLGFEGYLGEVYYGYRWIDFVHEPYYTQDGMWITEIRMPFPPHPLDEDEVNAELDEAVRKFNSGVIDKDEALRIANGCIERNPNLDPEKIRNEILGYSGQPDPRFG